MYDCISVVCRVFLELMVKLGILWLSSVIV